MIIVHDDNLQLQHILYEHPADYHEMLDDEGHRWLMTRERLPVDQIVIGVHPQYGHRKVYHKSDGYWVDVIAMDGYYVPAS